MQKQCMLILEDGWSCVGKSFGVHPPSMDVLEDVLSCKNPMSMGEVVFNTAMSGYVEVLTDPSFSGQIVCMTYPLIGNYGVDKAWAESWINDTTNDITLSGFIVKELYEGPLLRGRISVHDWMCANCVPGISGVDTRALTIHLRDHGEQNAAIVDISPNDTKDIQHVVRLLSHMPHMKGRALVDEVACDTWTSYDTLESKNQDNSCHVVVYDCGCKGNIVTLLQQRNCKVTVAPSSATASEILSHSPDMVLVSNGPGDPAMLKKQIACINGLVGHTTICGICLGFQLLGIVIGAKTYKMSFGHHGINHPVRDEMTLKLYITSQNHGFSLDEASLPDGALVWFRNTNDNTVEGFIYPEKDIHCVQFHPESAPGTVDAQWVFDYFIESAHIRQGSISASKM